MKIYKEGSQVVVDFSGDITFYRNLYAVHVLPGVEMQNIRIQNVTYQSIGEQKSRYRVLRFLKALPTLWGFCK